MKQTITLHFPTLHNLHRFSKKAGTNNFEISVRALLLSCDCAEEHIELATTMYGATIVMQEKGK